MNIVYKLTNTNKQSGKRFYIGSKVECNVIDINGIPTVISLKNSKPYYGSSSCIEFKEDFRNGDVFTAEILDTVIHRKDLIPKENEYIIKNNAVESDEYYNLAYATVDYNYDQSAINNIFGETIKEVANDRSRYSKNRSSVIALGFNHVWEFIEHVDNLRKENKTFTEIALPYGKKRHFIERKYRSYDIERFYKERLRYQNNNKLYLTDIYLVREMLNANSSYKNICKKLDISLLTLDYLSDNWDLKPKTFLNASIRGFTKEEFSKQITKSVLEGSSIKEAATEFKLDLTTCTRYFLDYVRNNLEISDL